MGRSAHTTVYNSLRKLQATGGGEHLLNTNASGSKMTR
jgi:hypothetical protein